MQKCVCFATTFAIAGYIPRSGILEIYQGHGAMSPLNTRVVMRFHMKRSDHSSLDLADIIFGAEMVSGRYPLSAASQPAVGSQCSPVAWLAQ